MTRASSNRVKRKLIKKKSPPRSRLIPGIPTKADHEQLLRVYSFFFGIAGALEGNPDLLGRAQGVAKGVLDELTGNYTALYGQEATEKVFAAISAEFNQPIDEKKDEPKAKKKRSTKPKSTKA